MGHIELQAVGRLAQIGELYDAKKDKFNKLYLFKSVEPDFHKITDQISQSHLDFKNLRTLEDRFSKMNISSSLKLSIISGIFEPNGFGKFLERQTKVVKSRNSLISIHSRHLKKTSIFYRKKISLKLIEIY